MAAKKTDAQILKEENPVNVAPIEAPVAAEVKTQKVTKESVPSVEPIAPKVKKIKVILTQDIDSLINGVRYQYPAKKMIEVPEDVAQILVHGNKGYRM